MSELAVLHNEIDTLPQHRVCEVLDFVGYLKEREAKQEALEEMDEPNEETIAAFEEGEAMMRGRFPLLNLTPPKRFWRI